MEKEEIELWYEEQKQHLSERYIKCIEMGMSVDQRQKKFDKLMMDLNNKYVQRLQRLDVTKKRQDRNHRIRGDVVLPVKETGIALAYSSGCIGGGVAGLCNSAYGKLHFMMQLFWTRNSYKFPEFMRRVTRPYSNLYYQYLRRPLVVLTRPFVMFGCSVRNIGVMFGGGVSKLALLVWKYSKLGFKNTVKTATAVSKKLSERKEALSKRYHDWYAKRLQEHLDKKQAKKEAKEAKKKAKEEAKKKKEEGESDDDTGDGTEGGNQGGE